MLSNLVIYVANLDSCYAYWNALSIIAVVITVIDLFVITVLLTVTSLFLFPACFFVRAVPVEVFVA